MSIEFDQAAFALELRKLSNESDPITFATSLARGKRAGISYRRLAGIAGCSEAHVRNMLKLLRLPLRDKSSIAGGTPYRPFLIKVKQFDESRKQKASLDAKSASDWQPRRAQRRSMRAVERYRSVVDLPNEL